MPVPASRRFSVTDPIVEINVGEPPTVFRVHKGVLLSSSEFIQTKLKPEWSESETAPFTLTDILPDVFDFYLQWLYTQEIPLQVPHLGPSNDVDTELHTKDWINLANAFVLGERLLDGHFKDCVMTAWCEKCYHASGGTLWPSISKMAHIIVDGTPENSPARTFLVDILERCASKEDFAEVGDLPKSILLGIVRSQKAAGQEVSEFDQRALWIRASGEEHGNRHCDEWRRSEDMLQFMHWLGDGWCHYHGHDYGKPCFVDRWAEDA